MSATQLSQLRLVEVFDFIGFGPRLLLPNIELRRLCLNASIALASSLRVSLIPLVAVYAGLPADA